MLTPIAVSYRTAMLGALRLEEYLLGGRQEKMLHEKFRMPEYSFTLA